MEQLLIEVAKQSPVALVGMFALWRISIVMIKLADALVEVSNKVTDSLAAQKADKKPSA